MVACSPVSTGELWLVPGLRLGIREVVSVFLAVSLYCIWRKIHVSLLLSSQKCLMFCMVLCKTSSTSSHQAHIEPERCKFELCFSPKIMNADFGLAGESKEENTFTTTTKINMTSSSSSLVFSPKAGFGRNQSPVRRPV